MEERDLFYAAGIIDGEGCITLRYHNKDGRSRPLLQVSVGNTDQWLVEWLRSSFGGNITYRQRVQKNWKPLWLWSAENKIAGEFLELIIPYLRLKKPQAELAIEFQSRKRPRNRVTLMEKELEEIQVQTMHGYNKKGINSEGVTDRPMPT